MLIKSKDSGYHHGNVKNELINAALEIMENEDLEKVSLRRLARMIGVTPVAVYNQFASKDVMMEGIKTRAFEEYVTFFDVNFKSQPEPEQNIFAICKIYFDFSRLHPTLFDVMYKQRAPRGFFETRRLPAYRNSRGLLSHSLADVYNKYQIPFTEESLSNGVLLIWAQLHGLVVLHESGSLALMLGEENVPEKGSPEEYTIVENLITQMTEDFYRTLRNWHTAIQQGDTHNLTN